MTLVMSDSLNATVVVIWPVSTISAKPEPLDDDPELVLESPRPPEPEPVAALELAEPEPDPLEADSDPFELEALPAEMISPGLVLASDTTVPLAGA